MRKEWLVLGAVLFLLPGCRTGVVLEFQSEEEIAVDDEGTPPPKPAHSISPQLSTRTSGDGRFLLAYGDPMDVHDPGTTDLFWYDRDGNLRAQVVGVFRPRAQVSLADNGIAVIVGWPLDPRAGRRLALYSSEGALLWHTSLAPERRVNRVQISPTGSFTAVATSIVRGDDEDSRVEVFSNGEGRGEVAGIGRIERLIFLQGERFLYVQGRRGRGMLDLRAEDPREATRWYRSGHLSLTPGRSVAMEPDKKLLFATTMEDREWGSKRARWHLVALDAETGDWLGETRLPRDYSVGAGGRLVGVRPGEIELHTRDSILKYRFKRGDSRVGGDTRAPRAPHSLLAFPDYGNRDIVLSWTPAMGQQVEGFDVERRPVRFDLAKQTPEPGGDYQLMAQLPAELMEWIDESAAVKEQADRVIGSTGNDAIVPWFAYRVRARTTDGRFSRWSTPKHASLVTVWPPLVGVGVDVLHNYGTPYQNDLGANVFHEGLDLIASDGTRVVANRGGVVTNVFETPEGGGVTLTVELAGAQVEDRYLHLRPRAMACPASPDPRDPLPQPCLRKGTTVAPGELLGHVNGPWFERIRKDERVWHLHLEHWLERLEHPNLDYPTYEDRLRNPLLSLPAHLQDPHRRKPQLGDLTVIDASVIDSATEAATQSLCSAIGSSAEGHCCTARGEVDLLVEAWDDMSPSLDFGIAPVELSYWIDSGAGPVVGSERIPLKLIRFDEGWIDGNVRAADRTRPTELSGLETWLTFRHWVLTNAIGTDGSYGNVDKNKAWWTKASNIVECDSQAPQTDDADHPEEACYPDGRYVVHVGASDLVQTRERDFCVMVDNWKPRLKSLTIRAEHDSSPVFHLTSAWDPVQARVVASLSRPTLSGAGTLLEARFTEPMEEVELCVLGTEASALESNFRCAAGSRPLVPADDERVVWQLVLESELSCAPCVLGLHGEDTTGNGLEGPPGFVSSNNLILVVDESL